MHDVYHRQYYWPPVEQCSSILYLPHLQTVGFPLPTSQEIERMRGARRLNRRVLHPTGGSRFDVRRSGLAYPCMLSKLRWLLCRPASAE